VPLLEPLLELVLGLAVRVFIWLLWAGVKFVARCVSTMVVDHPGLSSLLLAAAYREGWITDNAPWLAPWVPCLLVGLVLLAVARFFTTHEPKEIRERVEREARKVRRAAAPVVAGRDWLRKRTHDRADLPPPPALAEAVDLPPVPIRTHDGLGQPLDDNGRRFFALRDSGYRGWIDHLGVAVDQNGAPLDAVGIAALTDPAYREEVAS
jgi:hypothetical protein